MTEDDRLAGEQATLARAERLHWLHWLVVVGSIGITLLAWDASRNALTERMSARFDRESERIVTLFSEQLQRHSDILKATASLLSIRHGDIGPDEWRLYNENLDLPTLFPALTGLGVLRYVRADELDGFLARQRERYPDYALHPAQDRSFHLPIVHAPTARSRALGLDMVHDAVRRDAIERAVSSGRTQITAPTRLTYAKKLGFLMFTPFYHGDEKDWKRAGTDGMAGAVLALVRAENLTAGVLDRDKRLVWVRVSDAGQTLYDEHDEAHAGADAEPLFVRTTTVPLFGREWRFDIESTAAFRRDAASIEPSLILAGGLFIDLLLLAVFAMLSRSSAALRRKSAALEECNRALESFAYVASHDLKTPLNSIGVLAEFIDEDLDGLAANESALPEIHRNIGRILRQVRRGKSLVDGILEYSGLGRGDERPTRVDTRELVEGIGDTLQVSPERLVLDGDFPVLVTSETRLSQVLANLISNAFKYHHDAARARVVVRVEEADGCHRFSVEDDGPGIEPAYHERIFELFETLGSGKGIDSTGVGLSIVKKAVEAMGGSISVDSSPGRGTTFTFDWPTHVGGEHDATEPAQNETATGGHELPKAA